MIQFTITSDPDQKFSTVLSNKRVSFRFRFNTLIQRWAFDLALDDVPVITGRRVVTGVDLIEPFNLDIGKLFAVENVPGAVADRLGLPNGSVRLYQVTDAEYDDAISA